MNFVRIRHLCMIAALTTLACRSGDSKETKASSGPAWLTARASDEALMASKSSAFHDFHFRDQLGASGITFVNRIVDDAGKAYKAVHYDHGTGLAAADVDADGLPDLYFVTQLGTNELWKNLGGGRFQNITDSAGLAMPNAIAVGASFADIDNDGDPDLFVTTVRHGNRLFENLGQGKFRDITAQAGVGYVGHSSGATFFDYDGDGLLDLLVANVGVYTTNDTGPGGYYVGLTDAFHGHTHPERSEPSILYRNLGGNRFQDVTRASGLVDSSWSGDAVILDANNDGRPDVYLLNMQGDNHLWLNVDGKHFRDASAQYFRRTPWGAMGAKVFDYNGDGQLDLLVTDMHSDMFENIAPGDWTSEGRKSDPGKLPVDMFMTGPDHSVFGNALYENVRSDSAGNHYAEVSDQAGVETYWPWGPSVEDVNADGWDDVFITGSMNFPYRYTTNALLLNENGKHFLPSEFTLGVEPRGNGEMQPWFTVECGGRDKGSVPCVTCAKPNAAELGCRPEGSAGNVTMMGARGSRTALLADLNGDGAVDIVTNEFNSPPQLLLSDLATKKTLHYLQLTLRGTHSNREGLGARVVVKLPDGRRLLKVMDGKSGYLSQSQLPLYFGLGEADHAASIEVFWPSGKHQIVAGPVRAGQGMQVVEPQ